MKKIIALSAFALVLGGIAYAGSYGPGAGVTMDSNLADPASKTGASLYGDITTASTSTVLIGKTSTGVGLGALTSANGYAMATQHKSGNRAFGTAYDSTSVYYKDVTNVGTAVETLPTKSDSTEFSSWSSM
ncbi:hypothetical protein GMSM_25970 [Geomonas sp. Red276]